MEEAGYEVTTYTGKNYYKGYAVRAGGRKRDYDQSDVIRATSVRLNHDSLGLGTISYPTTSMTDEEFAKAESKKQDSS